MKRLFSALVLVGALLAPTDAFARDTHCYFERPGDCGVWFFEDSDLEGYGYAVHVCGGIIISINFGAGSC